MSTTDSTTTTATWQSNRARDFKSRTEGKLAAHWEEIRRHLAPPTVTWRWGESGLSMGMKYYLRDKGLIERAPSGSEWMTSMDLWLYVIEKAGDDEVVGSDVEGQQLLLEDIVGESRATRYLGETSARPSRAEQATLTADTADQRVVRAQHEPDWGVVNQQKGRHGDDDGRAEAISHPGQSRLQTFEDHDTGKWDVSVQWFRDSVVRTPAGGVY